MGTAVDEGGGDAEGCGDQDGGFGEGIEFCAEEFVVYFALGVDWSAVVDHVLGISILERFYLKGETGRMESTNSSSRIKARMERWSSLCTKRPSSIDNAEVTIAFPRIVALRPPPYCVRPSVITSTSSLSNKNVTAFFNVSCTELESLDIDQSLKHRPNRKEGR